MSECLYLNGNILAEPLVNQWYAWPYLISPATSAMVICNSQFKIMNSYLRSPNAHQAAVRNPLLLGGPFIDYPTDRSNEISALMESTKLKYKHLFEFVDAINQLNALLKNEASGESLIPFYEKIPAPLRGYLELVYDLNHQPSFRILESLLYSSRYNMADSQSMLFSTIASDYRPFVLSTPRLFCSEKLQISLPFNSSVYDDLFSMRYNPKSKSYINEKILYHLQLNKEETNLFWSYFTQALPKKHNQTQYKEEGIRIRYFGHASVLIQTNDVNIMIDPVISYDYASDIPRFTFNDLPESIDYVLLTHAHQDHVLLETLLQIRHKVTTLVVPKSNGGTLQDPSLKLIFKNIGFKNLIELDEMESLEVAGGSITGLPFIGEHSDLNIRSKLIYLINLKNKKILCAADTNNFEPKMYEHVYDEVKNIDILFLGMECDGAPLSWLYGSLYSMPIAKNIDQSRRLDGSNFERAINLVNRFHCKQVYVYAMGQEPWLNYVMCVKYNENSKPIVESNKLIAECHRQGIVAERLFGHKEIFI